MNSNGPASRLLCNICGSAEFRDYRQRSDGVLVVQCGLCGMGVVEKPPAAPRELYQDDYYHSAREKEIGYADYQFVAEHATAWAASLTRLLVPSGRVLDVGCADGHLLKKLLRSHECYGIEVNPRMAEICAGAGIRMIGADVFDPQLSERNASSFDVVLAIAVLEHLSDFRKAVQVMLELLKPEGTLVLEVPLISTAYSDDVWFRSSLEHIYYPSETSLHYLFERILELPLAGSEVPIMDYASTFVGLVPKDPHRGKELDQLYCRLALGPVTEVSTREDMTFRMLLNLVHAAQTTPEHVELLRGLAFEDLNPHLFQRLVDLWIRDHQRMKYIRAELTSIKASRSWRLVSRLAKLS